MRKILLLAFICSLSVVVRAQIDRTKYKIDTSFVPSEQNPSVLDTVFVVTKIETVIRKIIVETGPKTLVRAWGIQASVGASLLLDAKPRLEREQVSIAFSGAQRQSFQIGFQAELGQQWVTYGHIGYSRLLENRQATHRWTTLSPYARTTIDTTETYFVENEDGLTDTVFITETRQQVGINAQENISEGQSQNTYHFLVTEIGLGKRFSFRQAYVQPSMGWVWEKKTKTEGALGIDQSIRPFVQDQWGTRLNVLVGYTLYQHLSVFAETSIGYYFTDLFSREALFPRKLNAAQFRIGLQFNIKG